MVLIELLAYSDCISASSMLSPLSTIVYTNLITNKAQPVKPRLIRNVNILATSLFRAYASPFFYCEFNISYLPNRVKVVL